MAKALSNTFIFNVSELLEDHGLHEDDGPTRDARNRAVAHVKRFQALKDSLGSLQIKVVYYPHQGRFVNHLSMPHKDGGMHVFKSRAELMTFVKNGNKPAPPKDRWTNASKRLVIHKSRPAPRKAGMDGAAAIATVAAFVETIADVKATLVDIIRRKYGKIQSLGIWPEHIARKFRPDLYDTATVGQRIIDRVASEQGKLVEVSLWSRIDAYSSALVANAIDLFGGYDLGASRRLGKRGTSIKDEDKARILAILKAVGVPDIRMLQPFAGGTGRPNTAREQLLLACFMLAAVLDRLRSMYEGLGVSNSADLEVLFKMSGAPRVFNETWEVLLPLSRRDPFLTEDIMKKLCPDARTMYLSLLESRSIMVGDVEEALPASHHDEDGEPVDDLLMLEQRSESEADSDDGDPRVIKDDITLAEVRQLMESLGHMPDRMQTDLYHVISDPNMSAALKMFARKYSLTGAQLIQLETIISGKKVLELGL